MSSQGLIVKNYTNSTSSYNGALTVLGGLGVSLDVNVGGTLSSNNSCDRFTRMLSSTQLIFDMNVGMNYLIPLETSTFTSITFANIPLTPASHYEFNFLIKQPLKSDLYYLTPPSNIVNIIGTDLTIYNVICYGSSTINLPINKNYILQKIQIMNTGTLTVPSFMVLTSASGY